MENHKNTYVAKTFAGLEPVLSKELKELGASDVQVLRRAVSFSGDLQMLYRMNIWCRTAISILKGVGSFTFDSKDAYYEQMRQIPWHELFQSGKTISVHATAFNSPVFNNTLFLAQLSKDAIVDLFSEKTGNRPDVDTANAQVRIIVNVFESKVMVSLDSSGDPLFKRGYRKAAGPAPINEVLAAGLIQLMDWDMTSDFLDPMCGSGTFSIEAAMMSARMAPGASRKSYGFSHWTEFDEPLFLQEIEEAKSKQQPLKARIMASDLTGYMLDITRQNVMQAGLLGSIRIQKNDFFSYHPPGDRGWIILNPPYGHRIKHEDLQALHKQIGDTLKQRFSGYRAAIISSDLKAIRFTGLRPDRKTEVYNGPLKCSFNVYDLFSGKRSDFVRERKTRDRTDKRKRINP